MQTLASNANLHRIGLALGLERFINTPGGVSATTQKSVACTVEGLLGAIYVDSGLQEVKHVMDALGLVEGEREVREVVAELCETEKENGDREEE